MVEYIVEGNLIELDTQTEIELTISINDIRNPVTINNSWSKSIDIPGTPNNNRIFEFIYDNNIEVGYNPNLKRDCELRVDGIPIITGYQKINEIDIENGRIIYKVIIYGNNTTIFEEMGNSLLTELNLNKYNHTYSKFEVRKTWETANREGFYYPFANYHEKAWPLYSVLNVADVFPFYPGFYVKTLVDKIFETYGYEYDSNFFESDMFKSLYIPYTNSRDVEGIEALYVWERATQFYIYSTPIWYYNELDVTDDLDLYSGRTMTTPSDGVWELIISGNTLTGATNHYFSDGWFEVYTKNPYSDDPDFKTLVFSQHLENPNSDTTLYNFEFSYVFEDIPKNREVIIEPFAWASGRGGDYTSGFEYKAFWNFKPNIYFYGMDVKAIDTLPKNLKQKDFMNNLIRMFNLYVERDPNDYKRLTIEPFNEYYGRGTTIDWTYKVDETSRKYKLMSELNNRSYIFKYKEDKDYLSEKYKEDTERSLGDIQVFTQNDFLSKDEKIELLCSSTPIRLLSGTDYVYWPSLRKEMTEEKSDIEDFEIQTGWNWRILSQNIIELDSPYYINFDSEVYYNFYTGSHIVYSGETAIQSLYFDNKLDEIDYLYDTSKETPTLYSSYWDNYLNLIKNQNSRLLTMDIFLNTNDISNLRFYNKIFIKDSYYYLNSLTYSPTSKKSKVELLLIPATEVEEIYFSDLQISDKFAISGETFTSSIRVDNIGQITQTYYGTFYLDLYDETGSTWTNLDSVYFEDSITKNSKIIHTEELEITEMGYFRVRCEGQDKYNFTKYLYHLENPIVYDQLTYSAPNGLFTGMPITISFRVRCTDELYSDTLSGTITSSSSEYHNWELTLSGITTEYVEKTFTLESETNTFLLTGDYIDSISVYATDPTHNLIKGNWTFTPTNPSTSEQGDSLTANWKIINTGAAPASNLTITFWGYNSSDLDIPSYGPIEYTNQYISGSTTRTFSYTFDDLPDNMGSNIHNEYPLYIKSRLTGSGYNIWDDPATEGQFPIWIQPCGDDWGISNQSVTSPVTGNTTTLVNSFRLSVNGCKDIDDTMYQLKTTFYSNYDDGLERPDVYQIKYKWIPATPSGSYVDLSESILPPNDWTEGQKSIKVEILDPLYNETTLYTTGYTYYVGEPDIDYVSTTLHTPSNIYTIQSDLVAKNNGTGAGYAYATYDFRKPDNSVLAQFTGTTTYFAVGQTKTLSVATVLPSCLNGTFKCYTRLHRQDGSIVHSNLSTHVVDEYASIGFSGNELDLSGLGDKVINISVRFDTLINVSESCGYSASGEASIGYVKNSQVFNVISSSCDNVTNDNCSDNDTSTISITGLNSGSTLTITTNVDTYADQCEDIGGYARATIMGITIVSGGGAVCVGNNSYTDYGY